MPKLQIPAYVETAPEEFIDRIYDTWDEPPPDVDYGDIVIDYPRRAAFQFVRFGNAVDALDVCRVERSTIRDSALLATSAYERRLQIGASTATITKDQFAGGTLFVEDGRRYVIVGNTTKDTANQFFITLAQPGLLKSLTTSDEARLLSSPFTNWRKGTALASGANSPTGGVTPRSHASGMSGFCQIAGECLVVVSADISNSNNDGTPVIRVASGEVNIQTAAEQPAVGSLLISGAIDVSASDKVPILLYDRYHLF